ncbi:MAG: hypothetical protein K8S23_12405 [Candidatus Cloacimonetes bacterium]|nr:hypothetical protein [Candidatus Cloacimonadota bacterium]
MQRYLTVLHTTATKYSTELIAVGFDQAAISGIKTTFDKLLNANNAQKYYKGERLTITQQRIELMNATWEIVLNVCKAGKIIYADNPAKYKQYVIYESSSNTGSDIYQGEVAATETITIIVDGITPSTVLTLHS